MVTRLGSSCRVPRRFGGFPLFRPALRTVIQARSVNTDDDSARYVHESSGLATRVLGAAFILASLLFFIATSGVSRLECDEQRCSIQRAALFGDSGRDVVELDTIVLAESNWTEHRNGTQVTSTSYPVLRLNDESLVPLWPRRMSPIFPAHDATDVSTWAAGNVAEAPRSTSVLVSLSTVLGMAVMSFIGVILLWAASSKLIRLDPTELIVRRRGFIDPLDLRLPRTRVQSFGLGGEDDALHVFVQDDLGGWHYVTSDKVVAQEFAAALRSIDVPEARLGQSEMSTTRNVARSLSWLALLFGGTWVALLATCFAYVRLLLNS